MAKEPRGDDVSRKTQHTRYLSLQGGVREQDN